jgi:hypothetical protein
VAAVAFVIISILLGLINPNAAWLRYILPMAAAATYFWFAFGFDFSQSATTALLTLALRFALNISILTASYVLGLATGIAARKVMKAIY